MNTLQELQSRLTIYIQERNKLLFKNTMDYYGSIKPYEKNQRLMYLESSIKKLDLEIRTIIKWNCEKEERENYLTETINNLNQLIKEYQDNNPEPYDNWKQIPF